MIGKRKRAMQTRNRVATVQRVGLLWIACLCLVGGYVGGQLWPWTGLAKQAPSLQFQPAQIGEAIDVPQEIVATQFPRSEWQDGQHRGYIATTSVVAMVVGKSLVENLYTPQWVVTLIAADGHTTTLWGRSAEERKYVPVGTITPY
jgi:hypothetical protein